MQDENISFTEIKQEVKELAQEHVHNFKLSAIEYSSRLAGISISVILAFGVAVITLLFLSLMASSLLTEWLNSALLGYGLVATFYFLVLLICTTVLRKRIHDFFINRMVQLIASQTFNSKEDVAS